MTDWKENERKHIIQALNRIADNLGRTANGTKAKSKWIGIDEFPHNDWECSCCGFIVDNIGQWWIKDYNFCPHCGARMIFEEDGE